MSVYIFQLDTNEDLAYIETTPVMHHQQYKQTIDSHVESVDIDHMYIIDIYI